MQGLCTGSGWHEGQYAVEMRGEEKGRRPIAIGENLSFVVEGPRSCIGYRPPQASASLMPCPENKTEISSSQCEKCFQRAEILPCLRCDGERCRNPERRSFCVQPDNHAVYLASFGREMPKVGVARWTRREERVREQGARMALVVARDDGQMVRRLESEINKLGIPDRYTSSQKLQSLVMHTSKNELLEELLSTLALLRHRIRAPWIEPEKIVFPEPLRLPYRPELVSAAPGLVVRGEVLDIQGQLLFIQGEGDMIALDGGTLQGYSIRNATAKDQAAGQTSLSLSA